MQEQRERGPLIDLELDERRPIAADELVELTNALDAAEQRIGREGMHMPHRAQANRAETLQTRLQGRPELQTRRARAPAQLRERVHLRMCERRACEDILTGVALGEAVAAGRLDLTVERDHRADPETPSAEGLPRELDSAVHRWVERTHSGNLGALGYQRPGSAKRTRLATMSS